MPTYDERRAVAERLRGITVDDLVSYMDDGIDSASILFSEVHGNNEVRPFLEEARYLADLIEPSFDRDALMAQVKELEKCAWYFGLDFDEDEPLRDRLKEAAEAFSECALSIREALGVEQ